MFFIGSLNMLLKFDKRGKGGCEGGGRHTPPANPPTPDPLLGTYWTYFKTVANNGFFREEDGLQLCFARLYVLQIPSANTSLSPDVSFVGSR